MLLYHYLNKSEIFKCMLILVKALTGERRLETDLGPLGCVREKNKLVLTLVPLQLGEAANCSCLDYFHYNLIPEF